MRTENEKHNSHRGRCADPRGPSDRGESARTAQRRARGGRKRCAVSCCSRRSAKARPCLPDLLMVGQKPGFQLTRVPSGTLPHYHFSVRYHFATAYCVQILRFEDDSIPEGPPPRPRGLGFQPLIRKVSADERLLLGLCDRRGLDRVVRADVSRNVCKSILRAPRLVSKNTPLLVQRCVAAVFTARSVSRCIKQSQKWRRLILCPGSCFAQLPGRSARAAPRTR